MFLDIWETFFFHCLGKGWRSLELGASRAVSHNTLTSPVSPEQWWHLAESTEFYLLREQNEELLQDFYLFWLGVFLWSYQKYGMDIRLKHKVLHKPRGKMKEKKTRQREALGVCHRHENSALQTTIIQTKEVCSRASTQAAILHHKIDWLPKTLAFAMNVSCGAHSFQTAIWLIASLHI